MEERLSSVIVGPLFMVELTLSDRLCCRRLTIYDLDKVKEKAKVKFSVDGGGAIPFCSCPDISEP